MDIITLWTDNAIETNRCALHDCGLYQIGYVHVPAMSVMFCPMKSVVFQTWDSP